MDSDYSDLTDLDEDYKEKPKKLNVVQQKGAAYKIRNALKVPRATTYTAQALYDQIHSSDINLEPEYQRDVVWPETKQIGIIDSVFRNFYIPPVIFAVNSSEDGSETKTCIDGKQRLTSIHRFMDGLIPHKDPITGEKLWYKDVITTTSRGRPRRLLPEKYRRLFANKQIVCVEYQDITDSDEREIFQRVQLGMALTPAEKLQVISTPRAQFVRELQSTFLKDDGGLSDEALEWDRGRGSDFRCLAQAVFLIDKYTTAMKNTGTIIQLEKWLSTDDELPSAFTNRVRDTYRVFAELVLDKKLNKVFKKPAKVSPIEFILISLLIATWKDSMSKAQLSVAVGRMRDDVRDNHVDIRMNAKVAKTMLDFIKDAGGDVGGTAGAGAGAGVGEKRKRTAMADEEETKMKAKKVSPSAASKSKSSTPQPKSKPTPPVSKTSSSASTPVPPSQPTTTQPQASSSAIPDRMASLRAAKALASSQIRLPPPTSLASRGEHPTAPQILPSPGVAFSFPTLPQFQSNQAQYPQQTHYIQSQPQAQNTLEASILATMSRLANVRSRPEHTQAQVPLGESMPPLPQGIPIPILHQPPPSGHANGNGYAQNRRDNGIGHGQQDPGYHSSHHHNARDPHGGEREYSGRPPPPPHLASDSGWKNRPHGR